MIKVGETKRKASYEDKRNVGNIFELNNEATRCGGYSEDQFPPGALFAAVSDGLWDNGASCGRKYRVRCISGPKRPCKVRSIVVQVVDLCSHDPCPATLQLSNKAFDAISKIDAKVNVEYAQ
ncbi:hypothetical protein CXB51_036460 [Gossypium anomalum]|uniref:Expansin-like EG45 domain-containing protein n=1 Tax=Gossypium anomalum TaxID=47600 RepID=A0A8J5Y0A4_9ROSI|nr:hypothetical protein CXB51_036460 [Gossypium anomalum]